MFQVQCLNVLDCNKYRTNTGGTFSLIWAVLRLCFTIECNDNWTQNSQTPPPLSLTFIILWNLVPLKYPLLASSAKFLQVVGA